MGKREDHERSMEIIREMMTKVNDDELFHVWRNLTSIVSSRYPKDDVKKVVETVI